MSAPCTRHARTHAHAPWRHGRARRPRRAAPTGTTSGTPSGTHTCTRAAGDVGPYHAPRPVRTRVRGPPGTSAPTMPHALSTPMVGRDVPGAPRTRERHRGRPRERTRVRGPPGTSAPTNMHNAHHVHATCTMHTMSAPCTRHARTHVHAPWRHGRARRPRRAARTGTPTGTHTCTRAAGDVGPYHAPRPVRTHGRARRPRRAAHTGTPSGTPTCTRALSAPVVGPTSPAARPRRGSFARHLPFATCNLKPRSGDLTT